MSPKPTASQQARAGADGESPEAPSRAASRRRAKEQPAGARIRVKQVHSGIGFPQRQRQTLRGLGFRKLYQVVELEDTPSVRGMITSIAHLVQVQE